MFTPVYRQCTRWTILNCLVVEMVIMTEIKGFSRAIRDEIWLYEKIIVSRNVCRQFLHYLVCTLFITSFSHFACFSCFVDFSQIVCRRFYHTFSCFFNLRWTHWPKGSITSVSQSAKCEDGCQRTFYWRKKHGYNISNKLDKILIRARMVLERNRITENYWKTGTMKSQNWRHNQMRMEDIPRLYYQPLAYDWLELKLTKREASCTRARQMVCKSVTNGLWTICVYVWMELRTCPAPSANSSHKFFEGNLILYNFLLKHFSNNFCSVRL